MSGASILFVFIYLGIAAMAGTLAFRGVRDQKMVFIMPITDKGPFDRHTQPTRYWLSLSWAVLIFLAAAWGIIGTFTGDVGSGSIQVHDGTES